jgi:hypothetical protein
MTLKSLLESKKEYVYYSEEAKELWLSYGQGSGQTAQLPDIKKYLNSDSEDTNHYDSLVDRIANTPLRNKKIKSKSTSELYEVPAYPLHIGAERFDIWGGNIKPLKKKYYMIITKEKSIIINIFDTKKEAMNWINSIADNK